MARVKTHGSRQLTDGQGFVCLPHEEGEAHGGTNGTPSATKPVWDKNSGLSK